MGNVRINYTDVDGVEYNISMNSTNSYYLFIIPAQSSEGKILYFELDKDEEEKEKDN